MKILTFLHSFEPGGVERIALRLVREWRDKDVDAPLFLGRADGAMRDDVGAGLDIITPAQPSFSTAGWETLWMIATLPRLIRQQQPDILFCAGNSYSIVAVAMKLILGRKCPSIIAKISNDLDRHDQPRWQSAPYHLWLKFQARYLDHIIGMETPMADEIHEIMGVSRTKISIIPDPALSDTLISQLRRHKRPDSDNATPSGRKFISVGRLSAQKNIALMLHAFHRGAQPDDHLTIIGDGPDRPMLEILTGKLGINGQVSFRGYVSDPALSLPDHDIFLLSSDYEGVPAVILEALAAGLPIIATRCSRSMPALLGEGRQDAGGMEPLGQLVPINDEQALADAISQAQPGSQNPSASMKQARRFTIEQAAISYLRVMADRIRANHLRAAPTPTTQPTTTPNTSIHINQSHHNAQWGSDPR